MIQPRLEKYKLDSNFSVKSIVPKKVERITFCAYLKSIFINLCGCKVKNENKYLKKVSNAVYLSDKFRDIDFIIRKLHEVELLKSIVLNDQQIMALSLAKNPKVLDIDENDIVSKNYNYLFEDKKLLEKRVFEYYSELVRKENSLKTKDKILLDMLDEELYTKIIKSATITN